MNFKKNWNILLGIAASLLVSIGLFFFFPDYLETEDFFNISNLGRWIAVIVVGLMLIPMSKWKLKRHLRGWVTATITFLVLSILSFFIFFYFNQAWTSQCKGKTVLIGSVMKPNVKEGSIKSISYQIKQGSPDISDEELSKRANEKLKDSGFLLGKAGCLPTEIWTDDSIKARKIVLAVFYVLALPFFILTMMSLLQAVKPYLDEFTDENNETELPEKDDRTNNASNMNTIDNNKLKILFVAANPSNESRVQTDKEHRIIKSEMERGSQREKFEFLAPQFAVTIGDLIRAINDNPNVIHFSGHGINEGIIITNENNESQILSLKTMNRLFKYNKSTKYIILNSCYSAVQAKELSQFGMYVVGNNYAVEDNAAVSFSKGFYNGLGEGKKFIAAVNDGLIVVETECPNVLETIEVWKDGKKIEI